MRAARRVQLFSAFITVAGLGVVRSAEASPLASRASCAYCSDACVGDLAGFCHDNGCSASGASCTVSECEGIDNQFYTYDIECGAAS